MAIVQTASNLNSGTSTQRQVSFASVAKAGDTIVVAMNCSPNLNLTVTDNAGNTYISALTPINWNGSGSAVQVFYAQNKTQGTSALVVTISSATSMGYMDVYGLEISGPYILDVTNAATGTGTTLTSPTVATSKNGEFILGVGFAASGTTVPGAGYTTVINSNPTDLVEYTTQATAGNISASATNSFGSGNVWVMVVLTFRVGQIALKNFTLSVTGGGSTIPIVAASCSQADVLAALQKVGAGSYTVTIPSGKCIYTNQMSFSIPSSTTSLIIQGQTTVNCSGTPGTSSYACSAVDNTILIDQYASANQPIWDIGTGGSSSVLRITGLTFQGGTLASGNNKPNGFMIVSGTTQNLRVDHNHFNTLTYSVHDFGGGVTLFNYMAGVFDHNMIETDFAENWVRYYPESFGDVGWSQPSTPGGHVNTIFLENNYMRQGGFINDCHQGGRMVIRYNYLAGTVGNPNNSGGMQTHTISQGAGRFMGCRSMEQYHNYTLNPTPSILAFAPRDINSGSLNVAWNNTISTGWGNDNVFQSAGRALSGNNCGQGAGNAGGCPAPPNGFGYCGTGSSGVSSAWDGNSDSSGYPCLNAIGRGQMDLLNNQNFPHTLDSVTGTITWPNSLLEPMYTWGEVVPSGNLYSVQNWNGTGPVPNRDFYVECRPDNPSCPGTFNGTAGMGVGLLSGRPNTCTAGPGGTYGQSPIGSYGVGYWATDQNTLYICTSTNTWTAIYTPYQYPHPLDV